MSTPTTAPTVADVREGAGTLSDLLRAKARIARAAALQEEKLAAVMEGVAAPPLGEQHEDKTLTHGTTLVVSTVVDGLPIRLTGAIAQIHDTIGRPGELSVVLAEARMLTAPEGHTL